jgi:hypothetical protein
MQITLNESEIKKAIIAFVGNQGISITGRTTVKLVAGRGPDGMSATIDISNEEETSKDDDLVDLIPDKSEKVEKVEKPGLSFSKPAEEEKPVIEEAITPAEKPLFGKE